jgi:hypothetical protein
MSAFRATFSTEPCHTFYRPRSSCDRSQCLAGSSINTKCLLTKGKANLSEDAKEEAFDANVGADGHYCEFPTKVMAYALNKILGSPEQENQLHFH